MEFLPYFLLPLPLWLGVLAFDMYGVFVYIVRSKMVKITQSIGG